MFLENYDALSQEKNKIRFSELDIAKVSFILAVSYLECIAKARSYVSCSVDAETLINHFNILGCELRVEIRMFCRTNHAFPPRYEYLAKWTATPGVY